MDLVCGAYDGALVVGLSHSQVFSLLSYSVTCLHTQKNNLH